MKLSTRNDLFVVLLLAGLGIGNKGSAQTEPRPREEKAHHRHLRHLSDSGWRKDIRITDTTAALIINRIENINSTLNTFNDVIEKGYDTSDISEELPAYQRNINIIKYSISSVSGSLNLRNLSLLQDILGDITSDLKDWQSALLAYYTELVTINTQMRSISFDSTLQEMPADTALRLLYQRQTNELKLKWRSTDTTTKLTLLRIDRLQSQVSSHYIEAMELQGKINELIKAYNKKAFSNEYGYLWLPAIADSAHKDPDKVLERSVTVTGKVLQYYLNDNWAGRITAALLSVLFFVWVFANLRKVKKNNPAALEKLTYVRAVPVLCSLIFLFTILPFLDLHPPAVFVEMMQLLMVLSLSLLLWLRWPKRLFLFWLILFASLIFHSIKGLMISSTYSSRIWTFFIDLFSIVLGWILLKQIKMRREYFPRYMSGITVLYIILNTLAVLCNLFGRVTLTQVLGNTAISNFVQAIGLVIFIQIVLDAVYLQLEADKKSTRFTAYLNYQNVELRLRHVLTFVAGLFWFINLTQNLNVYDQSYQAITDFLTAERSVGSSSFTFGSILIFFFAIWIANILQKYIGYFFGDMGEELVPDKKTRLGTSILLIRLLVLTAGFFLGVLASGIPIDRVTIVIGALGVGIGLGLQNIVNNLVSGVILAIERPIQVGDLIEISGNSGRVKEIGIRSSHIVTADGAEIIIPNGDMLSQKLTNWTLSNTHLRVDINIKLGEGADLGKAKQTIMGILQNNELIMSKPDPQVLFTTITQTGAEMQILFWAFDINKWIQLKSDVLQQINEVFRKENITVVG